MAKKIAAHQVWWGCVMELCLQHRHNARNVNNESALCQMARQVARPCHVSPGRQHGNSGQQRTSVTTHASQSGIANCAIADVPIMGSVTLQLD